MSTRIPRIDSPLEQAVKEMARTCRRRQWVHCGFRFGLASLALVAACTALLAILPETGAPRYLTLGLFILAEAAAAWLLLIRPLRHPIDLQQVALFIDQQRPELENRIVSAMEFSEKPYEERSSWLVSRLQDDSWRAARGISFPELLDSRLVLRWAVVGALAWLGVFVCVGVYQSVWTPTISRFNPVAAASGERVRFTVEPGDARVRRGESPVVRVLSEQTADLVSILWRAPGGEWQTEPMGQAASPKIHFHQFANLQDDVHYQVRFGSAQSKAFHIAVWTPPEVDSIDLTYRYPEYLNLPPSETPHGGDITAVVGTEVGVAVTVNKPLETARLAFETGDPLALRETRPNRWEGTLKVEQNNVYHVELVDPEDAPNEFASDYRITAKPDDPPDVQIAFPRDDLEVTSLDEVPFEFKVDDDFGLSDYGIEIEVAGREPVRLPMGSGGEGSTLTAEGRHTMMLETLDLAPGDLVTWAVWAEDRKPDRAKYETLGYPYFLEIRPFRREFEEAVSDQSAQSQQQQQQQQQGQGNQQAMDQKEVLIATWNLRREAKNLSQKEFEERLTRIKEAQQGIKQRLGEQGMQSPQGAAAMPQALESIDKALEALERAAWKDPSAPLSEAIRHMQMAHRLLLRSRPERSQVQMARNQSGQQGQGQRQGNQREIQQLELRRNRNFYEQERRVQEQREATERTLNNLRDLAQRQRMINEEINRLISEMQDSDPQRREELARQLERLREEERRTLQQLDEAERNVATGNMDSRQARDTSRSLQDARQQMNRSLESMNRGEYQQARSAGSRAVRALGEAEEALQRLSRDAAAQRMAELQRRMEAMTEREEEIQQTIGELRERHEAPGSIREDENLDQERREVVEEKGDLAREFRDTLDEAADLAEGAEESQELMSRRLGDWLRETSREEIPEQIEGSRQLVEYGIWEPALQAEEQVRRKLEDAERRLAEVAEGAVQDDLEGMRRALDELQRLRDEERERRQLAQADPSSREGQDRSATGERGEGADRETNQQERQPGERGSRGDQGQAGQRNPQDQRDQNQQGSRGQQGQAGQRNPQDQQNQNQQGSQGQRGQAGQRNQQGQQNQNQQGERGQRGQAGQRNAQDQAGAGARGARDQQTPADREGGAQNRTADRAGGGGRWGDWLAPRTADEMRRFLERDAQDWIDGIRDAEALLPDDNNVREDLQRTREAILTMRRRFRGATSRSEGPPRFDLMKEIVGVPLALAAEELERQIRKREDAEKLILTDEDAVPEKYRKRVADYYESLSESDER